MRLKALCGTLFLLAASCLIYTFPASAEPQEFQGYAVSSTIMKLQGKPGDSQSSSLRIYNDSDTPVLAKLEVRDFEINGKQILYKSDVPTNWSVLKWTTFLKNVEVSMPPKSSTDVDFTVQIPKDAEQGEHRALIAIRFLPANASGNVKVATEILPVLYVTVTDPAGLVNFNKEWTLSDFRVDLVNGGFFNFQVKNTGNVHLESGGSITLKNLLTKQNQEIGIPTVNLLPNAEKTIQVEWNSDDWIGIYKANVRFTMDDTRWETRETFLFVIPWAGLAIILTALSALIIFGVVYVRRLKRNLYLQAREQAFREMGAAKENGE